MWHPCFELFHHSYCLKIVWVRERVRLLVVVPLALIGFRFSALNGAYYNALDDQFQALWSITILPQQNLTNNLQNIRSLDVPAHHTLMKLVTVVAAECLSRNSC
ncbi:hypothetical protein TNCT_196621 [Trichonephila clavata]|uniref:Uncharacterized protein n=1 Tax=Trichonephila clavata TaxID=2740835 RepID=A0A8X6KUJ0_TRICU|nr:hypothetical protein TNCT_196621 [Trichonephila clavata]